MVLFTSRTVIKIGLAAAIALFSFGANASQCAVGQVKEVGTWINPDSNTGGITKAVIAEECRDDSRRTCNGNICTITHGVKLVYTAQLWGKCHPSDCKWDKVDGVRYSSTGWLHFVWNQTYATRDIWAKIWSGGDNWLDLVVDTDFHSASRTDYRFRAWMQRD